jgi:hypothetical protein
MGRFTLTARNPAHGELPAAAPSMSLEAPMSAVTLVSAARRVIVPHAGIAGHLLVVSPTVMALGLGALIASLAPFASDLGGIAQPKPPVVIDRDAVPRPGPWWDGPERAPAMPRPAVGTAYIEIPLPHVSIRSRDIGQHDSPQDPRAFLIDAAIQIHSPASAPAPQRRSVPPHPHGVD